jgi:hypothetical protein
VLGEAHLEAAGWFDVRVIPLGGRGTSPVAYRLRWGGKTVLVPGRIPTRLTPPVSDELLRDVPGTGDYRRDYLRALDRLHDAAPNLWLPAAPVHGQNANLYDSDWQDVLQSNRRLLE